MERPYKKRRELSQEELLSVLRYVPETGEFFWVRRARGIKPGRPAGTESKKLGIRLIRYLDTEYPASRLAWLAVHGVLPDRPVKFLDGDALNTRIANMTIQKARPKSDFNLRTQEGRKAHHAAFKDYHRANSLRNKFGIDMAEYQRMFVEQNGCCAVCEKAETKTRGGQVKWLAVDHDHETGEVRGLLCQSCNLGIGHLGDDIKVLSRAISYLGRKKRGESNVVRLVRNTDGI